MVSKSLPDETRTSECVILLHGLARTSKSFVSMEASLKQSGYQTINYSYPSTKFKIETLAENAINEALAMSSGSTKIHFVTHSMGGILVRQYLHTHSITNLGRVVMLGPPNQGSQVVDNLKNMPGFKLINGPAGMQLGTEATSTPNKLGSAKFDVGVIAGNRSINFILSTMLPGDNDGKVTVTNTKLEGMKDHITLPVTHPLMMNNPRVIKQTKHFLEHGKFER
ncbi:esterase/lipase family protein [Vibrio profundi]|uniref:esterase/lipase family protein n=1 Tax=Vibrio profundi TaxID=1774960 RepID=UPI003736A0D9